MMNQINGRLVRNWGTKGQIRIRVVTMQTITGITDLKVYPNTRKSSSDSPGGEGARGILKDDEPSLISGAIFHIERG